MHNSTNHSLPEAQVALLVVEFAQYRRVLAAERLWVAIGSKPEAGNSKNVDSKNQVQNTHLHQHDHGVLKRVLEEKFLIKLMKVSR